MNYRNAAIGAAAFVILLMLILQRTGRKWHPSQRTNITVHERYDTLRVTVRDSLSPLRLSARVPTIRRGSKIFARLDTLLQRGAITDTIAIEIRTDTLPGSLAELSANIRYAPRSLSALVPVTLRDSIIELQPEARTWYESMLSILSILGAAAVGWLIRGLF